jgi:two-component system chemotaxis sensor kinase CheA
MTRAIGDTFREEALELLAELEQALLELEACPEDAEAVSRVFRALHTIKGAGAMAGFEAVSTLVHDIESVFELVRSGLIPVTRELIGLTLIARDRVRTLVENGERQLSGDQEVAELLAALRAFLPEDSRGSGEAGGPGERRAPAEGATTWRLRFRPPRDIFRRGLNPLTLLRELERLGECRAVAQIDAIPELSAIDPEACYLYWDIILTTAQGEDAIRDVFIFVEDEGELRIEVIDDGGSPAEAADGRKLGEILVERGDLTLEELQRALAERRLLGEVLVERGLVDGGKVDAALAEQQRLLEVRQQREAKEAASTIRVRSERLDSLVDLIGELVTVQARLSQTAVGRADAGLLAIAEEVERLTWALRDQVLGIRMLPIATTFSRFRRLVRDLAGELGKEVELVAEGGETELDKTVLERLGDPLVHLIRNGIDHGIETPHARQEAGKPKRGRIRLAASHCGANVRLEVSDDGAGLDPLKIRSRAEALGLLAPGAEMSERELFDLIFHSGLSTAGSITSVSGRGVGMDVVKRAIDELRGTIEVTSRPGAGTTFAIALPLTLAIIDGLMVRVGGDHFVLPLSSVEECIELTAAEAARTQGRNLVRVRGEIVPYIRLRERFRVGGERPAIEQVVIAESRGQRVGFAVDHVIGGHQTVIKSLGRLYREVAGLSGATILGDGTVALILDIPQLVAGEEQAERLAVDQAGI